MAEQNKNNAVAVKQQSANVGDQVIARINQLCETGFTMPKDYNWVNAIKMSMLKLQDVKDRTGKPALQVCKPNSVTSSLFKMATQGLNLALNQCYFIVYGDELVMQPSYFGKVLQVKRIFPDWEPYPHTIREGDVFEFEIDPKTGHRHLIKHEQTLESMDKPFIGGYVILPTKEGDGDLYIMTKKQVLAAWAKSSSKEHATANQFDEKMVMKGLSVDTPLPTPNGFTTMGEIQVGDKLYNANGQETTVVAKSEVKHLQCYKITFQNGESVIADEEHRWYARAGKGYCHMPEWGILTTQELYVAKTLGLSIVTPQHPEVEFEEKKLSVDPYILGYWLGNGSSSSAQVTAHEDDAEEIAAMIGKCYNTSITKDERSHAATINISSKTGLRSDNSSLLVQLKQLGVYQNKHIPDAYMRSSIQQRRELIRGLCDSDGCIDTIRGRVSFTSTDKDLAENVYSILSSLGENASCYQQEGEGFGIAVEYYVVQWQPKTNPFHLKRKADRFQERTANTCCPIKSIEKIDSVPTQCLAVDCGDATEEKDFRKSFLFGKGFFVTHNTVVNSGCNMIINSTPSYYAGEFDKDDPNAPEEQAQPETIAIEDVNIDTGEVQNLDETPAPAPAPAPRAETVAEAAPAPAPAPAADDDF